MTKIYTLEVTKESRALVTVEAENLAEAQEQVKKTIDENTIDWKMQDHIIIDVVNTRDKE